MCNVTVQDRALGEQKARQNLDVNEGQSGDKQRRKMSNMHKVLWIVEAEREFRCSRLRGNERGRLDARNGGQNSKTESVVEIEANEAKNSSKRKNNDRSSK